MGARNSNVGTRVRLSEAGRARVQSVLPADKVGEALYAAVAELREAPSRDMVARILDPERRHGVNYDTLVQFFLALGLTVTEADWEPVTEEADALPESIGYRTLVFTDMESSSAKWNEKGDAFEVVRKRHQALVRDAAQQNQGEVVDFMGDGAFVVFSQAVQALNFAIAVLMAIKAEPWSTLCPGIDDIKVRIGLHTGRVILSANDKGATEYSGPPVNLAARISDAAHGGQIVVCDTGRREIWASQGKSAYEFKDCGQHGVKDFDEGVWLWQPLREGLQRDFDPIIRKPAPLHARPVPRAVHSSQPQMAGDYMVGRNDLLETLHQAFQSENRQAWQQALIGELGIGKRTIAEEYERRYSDWYEDVFWLSGTSEETLRQHLVRIAQDRHLYISNVKNDDEYIEAAQQRIGNVRDALVVVHNLAFPLELKKAFRHGIGGRLLVTTTDPKWLWKELDGRHVVPALDITDAARYLRLKSGRDATDAEAEDLADMLRGLPGDLEQVAVALQLETGLSWAGQAEELRHRNLNFAHQYGALQALLRASLFLANEPIPVAFAQQYCKLRQADWQQTLHHLDRRALIRRDRTAAEYTVTPSIRAMEWAVVPEANRPSLALGTCKVLERVFPTPKNTTWPICERLILHALECAHHVETYGLKGKEVGTLLYRAYLYLCQRHRYIEAMPILERVQSRLSELQLTETDLDRLAMEAFDAPDLATARKLNDEGFTYYEQGRFYEAEPLFKQALEIRQRVLPADHPAIATSLNNLAVLYKAQGRYEEAEPMYKQALEIRQRVLPADHPAIANSLNNLAGLYEAQGRYEEAEPMYKQALEIRQRVLPADHPDIANSLNNLAGLYRAQGRYEEAEPMYKQALEIRQRVLPADHPGIATDLNNLAALYEAQGRYKEAEPMYKQALAILQRVLPTDHPNIVTVRANLAALRESQAHKESE